MKLYCPLHGSRPSRLLRGIAAVQRPCRQRLDCNRILAELRMRLFAACAVTPLFLPLPVKSREADLLGEANGLHREDDERDCS